MINQNNMTAVEWLWDKLLKGEFINDPEELFNQANEMEKQQITDAYRFGLSDEYVIGSQKYYNETFKSE